MTTGGARPNQFKVILSFPSELISNGPDLSNKAQFTCKAASLPSSNVQDIQVLFRGRQVHFAGERIFSPWQVSVYTDNDFSLRAAFEEWTHRVQNRDATNGVIEPAVYQVDLEVHQEDRNNNVLRKYKFIDAYPTAVGAIQLDFDNGNQVEMFDIEFMYNYWILID